MKNAIYISLFFSVFILTSCRQNKLDIDVSSVQINPVEIKRLEKDLFEMDPNDINAKTSYMVNKYGSFYVRFVTRIINDGGIRDSSYASNLRQFLADRDMRDAYNECIKKYPDLDFLNQQLTDAFKHFKFYFPQKNIPRVVTYMSGFNYAVATDDSTLGIGLEMYLGRNNKFYQMTQFPKYKTLTMDKEYILPDCMRGWLTNEFENNQLKDDFLSQIVQCGKIMYLLDAVVPEVDDTLKTGYTCLQLEWCKKNEFSMWTYFIEQKMLYSMDHAEIMKFITEGPFTSAFGKESPARTGCWVGWQIVRSYMSKHPEITLQQLMDDQDAQKILTQSKYKPEK